MDCQLYPVLFHDWLRLFMVELDRLCILFVTVYLDVNRKGAQVEISERSKSLALVEEQDEGMYRFPEPRSYGEVLFWIVFLAFCWGAAAVYSGLYAYANFSSGNWVFGAIVGVLGLVWTEKSLNSFFMALEYWYFFFWDPPGRSHKNGDQ